jgi:hypothetical protein
MRKIYYKANCVLESFSSFYRFNIKDVRLIINCFFINSNPFLSFINGVFVFDIFIIIFILFRSVRKKSNILIDKVFLLFYKSLSYYFFLDALRRVRSIFRRVIKVNEFGSKEGEEHSL